MDKNASKVNKKEKKVNPAAKFIWLGIAVVIAVVGFFLRTSMESFTPTVGIVLSVLLMFSVIMASQGQSAVRIKYSAVDDEGKKIEKKKYFLATFVYYLFILAAVVCAFLSLWMCEIISF